MADVIINKFRASVVRDGSKPSSPGFIVSEGQDPVNPPGTNNYVPYSGATANVDLGEFGVKPGFITLDTTPTNTPTDQGTIYWDVDDETVDIVLNGYTMKIGEDLFYPVKNQTGSTIAKGVAVRFNGTLGASGRLLIAPFIADGSVPSSRFMGVTAEEILNGEDGKVLYFGRVRGINTNGFNEGDILYASTTSAGGYQTAIPVAPNNIVQVAAVVTKSATVGTIFVRPTLGSNINTDEGVKIVSVADKNLLQYQSGTSLWENKSLAQVLGGTSAQFVKGDGSLDSSTYGTGTVTSVGLSSATSGVTIGSSPVTTSGTITLAIATASGSQNGLLSSTDWSTFNSKQNALTNPVTGTGTTNYLPKFTGSTTIGNSTLQETAGNLGLGITPSAASLPTFENQYGFLSGQSEVNLTTNAYFNSGFKFIGGSNFALRYHQSGFNGQHQWLVSSGGTAGNAISFTQAMTLTSGGNLLVGTTTDNGARLQVSGRGTFTAPSGQNALVVNGVNSIFAQNIVAGTGTSTSFGLTISAGTNSSDIAFQIYNAAENAVRLFVRGDGNVGIGTASPAFGLHLQSTDSAKAYIRVGFTDYAETFVQAFSNGGYIGTHNNYPLFIRTNNVTQLTVTSGGNVLIGTTTDNGVGRLQVSGSIRTTDDITITKSSAASFIANNTSASGKSFRLVSADDGTFRIQNTGILDILTLASTGAATFSTLGTGSVTATGGTLSTVSDSSYKIEDGFIDSAIEKVLSLKPRYFYWNKKSGLPTDVRQLGFYAQEVNQCLGEEAANTPKNKNTPWGISDRSIIAMLTKAIQELKQEIDTLKN